MLYVPAAGFDGVDQFAYVVSDGRTGMATGTVMVTVLDGQTLTIRDLPTEPAATNNSATVVFIGRAGRTYRVQASDNFVTWMDLGTVTPVEDGLVKFFDPDAATHPRRFYRWVLLP
jgi:hypothetical protein